MFQLNILNKLLYADSFSKSDIDYILDRSTLLFDSDVLEFFNFTLSTYKTYGSYPTPGYLTTYFEGEKTSQAAKIWDSIQEVNSDEHTLKQWVDLQANFRLRKRLSDTIDSASSSLVSTPDSELSKVTKDLSLSLATINSLDSADRKASISSIRGLSDLVMHYKTYFDELDKYKDVSIGYGFDPIDSVLGMTAADFTVLAGFTGDGKSTLAREIAYRNILKGHNILMATTEMPHDSLMDFFISLHSRHPKWGKHHPILKVRDISTNQLDSKQKAFLFKVADDFENNPDHGSLKIVEPLGVDYLVSDMLDEITTTHFLEFHIDLFIWDYLTNSKVVLNRTAKPEDYNQAIVDTKRLTTSLRIPAIICAQVNREGNKSFLKDGFYDLSALSTYNELERSATQVIFTGRTREDKELGRFRIQHSKNRFGKLFDTFNLFIDPTSGSLLEEATSELSSDDILDMVNKLDF